MESLLLVGAGDIAARALPALVARYKVYALVRERSRVPLLAALGVDALVGDLDRPETLIGLAGLADRMVILAPPPDSGTTDTRTRHLLHALATPTERIDCARDLKRLVYISTSGVYGDCAGDWVDETRRLNPQSARAQRRVDAEAAVANFAGAQGMSYAILRVPGIYAADRLPLVRLQKGTAALLPADDVYTNHIHATDLAAAVVQAIAHDRATGLFNITDDSAIKMGDFFDLVADRFGLPRPPRVSRVEAARIIAPMLLSFMSESRRLVNRRMKTVLGVNLRYPTVHEGVSAVRSEPV